VPLESKLGPVVFQFDASFRADALPILAEFLAGLSGLRNDVKIRLRFRVRDDFSPHLESHYARPILAGRCSAPRVDRVRADLVSFRLLDNPSAIPQDSSRGCLERGRELPLWAGRILGCLGRGLRVYPFANNRCQGNGPAIARLPLSKPGRAIGET
jgi:uncharacterized protein YecE (DUF72 family)